MAQIFADFLASFTPRAAMLVAALILARLIGFILLTGTAPHSPGFQLSTVLTVLYWQPVILSCTTILCTVPVVLYCLPTGTCTSVASLQYTVRRSAVAVQ
jgi:hypothetical protein